MATNNSGHHRIFVVLATWNGEDYVAEQIESIRDQTESNWTLVVRDDGSTDETISVLNELSFQDPRIEFLSDERGRLGPSGSFGILMQAALDRSADYVFLSDQDDVWDQNKIAEQLQLMLKTEHGHGHVVPTLIHSNLAVTNSDLNVLQSSYFQTEKLPEDSSQILAALLTRNYAPGCSMLLNRPLLELALPLPAMGMMHDHWAILCAAAGGKVDCIQRPLLQYRRHENNVTPTGLASVKFMAKLQKFFGGETFSHEILDRRWQCVEAARILLERLPKEMTASRKLLQDFARAFTPKVAAIRRVTFLWKLGIPVGYSLARAIVYYAQIVSLGAMIRNVATQEEVAVRGKPTSSQE